MSHFLSLQTVHDCHVDKDLDMYIRESGILVNNSIVLAERLILLHAESMQIHGRNLLSVAGGGEPGQIEWVLITLPQSSWPDQDSQTSAGSTTLLTTEQVWFTQ
jgi:hypothetical protein